MKKPGKTGTDRPKKQKVSRGITDRKKAEKELHHSTKALSTLLEVSKSLVATLDLHTVLQATTEGAAQLFGLDTAAVYLIKEDLLRLYATTPPLPPKFPEELRNAPLADHPHIHKALTSGAPVLVPDMVKADLTPAERSVAEKRHLHTVIFLPLIAEGKPVGTLIVGSVEKPQTIPEA